MFERFYFSWNDKGEYVVGVGSKYYQFKRKSLKYWMKHFIELIEEIKQENKVKKQ